MGIVKGEPFAPASDRMRRIVSGAAALGGAGRAGEIEPVGAG